MSDTVRCGRSERIFRWVLACLLIALALLVAPGYFFTRGYRRAHWASQRGIKLLVRPSMGTFAVSVTLADDTLTLERRPDESAYHMLRNSRLVSEEAGGTFWQYFYGLGTHRYHINAGSLPAVTRNEEERATARDNEKRQALEEQEYQRELKKEISSMISRLGSDNYEERQAASKDLSRIGRPALPQLTSAVRSSDQEVATRAARLIEAIIRSR